MSASDRTGAAGRPREGAAGGAAAPEPVEPESVEALVQQFEEEKPPAAGPAANVAAAVVVVLLGVAGVVGARDLGLGSASSPDSGTWPLVISAALVVLGVVLAVTARSAGEAEKFTAMSWNVLLGLATMVGFAVTVGRVGFEIPSALLAFVWLKVLGREGWRTSVVGAVVMTAVFYLIFVVALGTTIPHLF